MKEHAFIQEGSAIFLLIMNTNYKEAKNFEEIQKRRCENSLKWIKDYQAKQKKQEAKNEGYKQKEEEEEEKRQKKNKKDLEKQENIYHAHKKTFHYYTKFKEIFTNEIFLILYTPFVSKTTIKNLIYEGK